MAQGKRVGRRVKAKRMTHPSPPSRRLRLFIYGVGCGVCVWGIKHLPSRLKGSKNARSRCTTDVLLTWFSNLRVHLRRFERGVRKKWDGGRGQKMITDRNNYFARNSECADNMQDSLYPVFIYLRKTVFVRWEGRGEERKTVSRKQCACVQSQCGEFQWNKKWLLFVCLF